MNYQILIAEDDPDISELLSLYLENAGYTVFTALNGRSALEIFQEKRISLALVDIMMPGLNGYDLIRRLREVSNIPVIILSAKSAASDRVFGLDVGADAYLTKPFNPLEVLANIRALLRRYCQLGGEDAGDSLPNVLKLGELELNLDQYVLKKRGETIPLTSTEMKIMARMMKEPGRVFTKAQLYQCINGDYYEGDDKTMMVHIYNIRAKLEENPGKPVYIKTVRGLGYKLECHES